jgi:hypothetical protein
MITRILELEAGSWKPEAGSWKLEAGSFFHTSSILTCRT